MMPYRISDAERQRRADAIRKVRPWLRSTGPTSAAGKRVSSMNRLRHGRYSRLVKLHRVLAAAERGGDPAAVDLARAQWLDRFTIVSAALEAKSARPSGSGGRSSAGRPGGRGG